MDYASHYNRLIDKSKNRELAGYGEKHHITPRCMGGGNGQDNIAVLTAEEHFMAHKLLVMMHPDHPSLVYGAKQMSCVGKGQKARATNKVYGWLRRKLVEVLAVRMAGNDYAKGNALTAETRQKMSAARTGHKHSEETKAKIRETNIRTKANNPKPVVSEETRQKLSEASKGRTSAMKGRKHSPETKARMTESQLKRAAMLREARGCNA